MSVGICYLDASAFVKLLSPERESIALKEFLEDHPGQTSSAILDIEAHRVATRLGPAVEARVARLLAPLNLVPLNAEVRALARIVAPPALRTLDAIHLASAIGLGADLGVFVAYDNRLLEAAAQAGLPVAAPI